MDDEITRLRRRVDRLESGAREIDYLKGELTLRIDELDQQHDTRVREAEERTSAIADDVEAMRSDIRELAAEVDRLSRATSSSADAPRADFDTLDDSDNELVARANAAAARRASFADPLKVEAQQEAVDDMSRLESRYEIVSHSLYILCQEVLSAAASDGAYIDRDQQFERAAASVEELCRKIHHQRPEAIKAARAVAVDRQRRADAEDAIVKGDAALAELKQNCRTRLDDALSTGAVLPFWFTSALRHAPPHGKVDEWLNVAVDVLIFRLLHGVTDRSLALGPRPASGQAPSTARTTLEQRISALYR